MLWTERKLEKFGETDDRLGIIAGSDNFGRAFEKDISAVVTA